MFVLLFANTAFADYYFDNFSASDLSSPFTSGFEGYIPLKKQQLTAEQKERIRLAREEMEQKKLAFTSEVFIKQIKKNKTQNVALMLDAGMNPNTDYFGEYALFYASKNNKTETALLLLERGANPNVGFDSPLFWAVKNNNFKLAEKLIEKGAKLDFTELVSSDTILYTALKNKRYEIAKLLIENGAKIDGKSAMVIEKRNLYNTLGVEKF